MSASQPQTKPVQELVILPVDVDVDGCTATILEAAKLPLPWEEYTISVQLRCDNVLSNTFTITYRNNKELTQKLKTEVAKFKYLLFLYDKETLRKMGLIR